MSRNLSLGLEWIRLRLDRAARCTACNFHLLGFKRTVCARPHDGERDDVRPRSRNKESEERKQESPS